MAEIVEVFFYDVISKRKKKSDYGYVIRASKRRKGRYIKKKYKTANRMKLYNFYCAIKRALKKGSALNIYTQNEYIFDCLAKGILNRWIKNNFMAKSGLNVNNYDIWIKICETIGTIRSCKLYLTHQKISFDKTLKKQLAYINEHARSTQIYLDL